MQPFGANCHLFMKEQMQTIAFAGASKEPVQFYPSFSDPSDGSRVLFAHNKYWDMVNSSVCRDPAPQGQGSRGTSLWRDVWARTWEQTLEPISILFVSHAKEAFRNTLSPSLMSYFRTRTNSLQSWILLSENMLKSVLVPSDTDWCRWTAATALFSGTHAFASWIQECNNFQS